ncbi:growth-regulating factor 8-like [Nicotiana tabacum]|uniref:Growth-regulating factor n=1 Tax=Nicotiana tabacum TaxID=4097 RepID=A0A1S3XWV8_TOBAC|nr:PREDICTED: growth-regulating factor 8-like [Nicotiana tabacum]
MGNGENTELLDLKMKTTESSPSSYPYKRTMFMSPSSHPHLAAFDKETSSNSTCLADDGGSGGGGGGGPGDFVGSDSYAAAALSSRALQPFSCSARESMFLSGKAPFTASQLQEFQRQTIICKYIMASVPVPPQLLLPLSNNPSSAHLPQSNTSGLDLKFSRGSDPEPWRCKRTDGKKWRCTRDVAPDQKYCERHAHKSKPRSRKPVEIHNTNNNSNNRHPPPPTTRNHHRSLQFPTVQLSEQTRCIEWLGRGDRGGTIPIISCNQQNLQQLMQSSSGMGFNNDHTDLNRRNTPAFQMQDEAKLYPMNNFNQYISNRSSGQTLESSPLKNEECSDSVIASLQGRTTRDFIDAWSKDGLNDGISNNGSFTSLTLSMSGWNHGMDEDNEHAQVSINRMLDSERSSDEVLRSQWLSPVSWMSSTAPGGPLGEALCLGNATNLPSPHGYSNSTANSSCSFNSCENGSHGLDFIG